MKKLFSAVIVAVLALCLVLGCASAYADVAVNTRVYTLNGTTGFGMAGMIADAKPGYSFTVETDPSVVTAALISGDCDIAALPTNAASALYNKTRASPILTARRSTPRRRTPALSSLPSAANTVSSSILTPATPSRQS